MVQPPSRGNSNCALTIDWAAVPTGLFLGVFTAALAGSRQSGSGTGRQAASAAARSCSWIFRSGSPADVVAPTPLAACFQEAQFCQLHEVSGRSAFIQLRRASRTTAASP